MALHDLVNNEEDVIIYTSRVMQLTGSANISARHISRLWSGSWYNGLNLTDSILTQLQD